MKPRHLILLALAVMPIIAPSCISKRDSDAYMAPEFISTVAMVDGLTATLSAELSSARVETAGFVYWRQGEDKQIVPCELSELHFSANLTGLIPGTTYQWFAFIRAGSTEMQSGISTFETKAREEPVPPIEGLSIPDPYFRQYLLEHFDENGDGILTEQEGMMIRKITVITDHISSMRGIEHFKNLDSLICRGSDIDEYEDIGYPGLLDTLDVSANRRLRFLACDRNMLRSLNISDNPFLEEILCSFNLLEEIDLSGVPRLKVLRMWVNEVKSLDFSNTPLLFTLECGDNLITSIDISPCPRLDCLNLSGLRIKELDLSNNPNLVWLGTFGTDISYLDLSHNPILRCLNCENSPISELDLSVCPRLIELKCFNCVIKELDVSMLPELEILECSPMPGIYGKNLLQKLYVFEGQIIQGVTVNRSVKNIPDETEIITVQATPQMSFASPLTGWDPLSRE